MPMVPKPVSDTRVAMARLAIIVTVCAWLAYTVMWFFSDFFHPGYEGAVARTEEVLYLVIVTLLTVSAVAYLLARLGFMYRTRTHHRATRASLDQYYDARQGNVQPAVADTNPADAPYPLWSASASYPLGYKVVENGEIYQAKWYNSGDDPGHVPGLGGRRSVPGRRQGAVPGTAVCGQVVEPGRLPRDPVERPGRLGVEGAVQHPGRAEWRPRRGRRPQRLVVSQPEPVPLARVAVGAGQGATDQLGKANTTVTRDPADPIATLTWAAAARTSQRP
jgi:hypothetical protein